uniref:Uncharacterized protein n=1 Tax=Arundo donax TaxID=35708 RepID=A0A0A9G5I7_ARUDO
MLLLWDCNKVSLHLVLTANFLAGWWFTITNFPG